MHTDSNQKHNFFSVIGKKCLSIMVSILVSLVVFAQETPVSVSVIVAPPYTSSLSSYINTPNKIIISLTHTSPLYPDIDLYLKISITGDNGISAISEDTYKPAVPITLNTGSTYLVNTDNIYDAFNLNHITITGTSLLDLLSGAGLPEGAYQICARAFDFETGEPLSADEPMGCSSIFFISNLEPPVIQNPICGDTKTSYGIQNVTVNWNIPAGAPMGTTYHFEMVEIPDNVEIDPNEAFLISKYPVLYEKTQTQTMLLLTSGEVTLTPGYTYAMRVTAEDPTEAAHFRNNGTSEVCWFKYEQPTLLGGSGTLGDSVSLVFLNPKKNADTLGVNNENDFLLNWCWIKNTDAGMEMSDHEVIAVNNLEKYVVTLAKETSGGGKFSFSDEFLKVDSTGLIQSYLQISKDEALKLGFEDGATYKAVVDVYNSSNQWVKSAESPGFVFKILNDEVPAVKVPVRAVVNYGFKNYSDIFPVSNSEVIIDALIRQSLAPKIGSITNDFIKDPGSLPAEKYDGSDYVKIASVVATTSSIGQLDTIIAVPEPYFKADSIAFRIRLANSYYVDRDFEPVYLKASSQDMVANFGTLTAKTYAYSLKLNVQKEFTSYRVVKNENGVTVSLDENGEPLLLGGSSNETDDQQQQYTFSVEKETAADGIPVVLYRESKKENIPIYEGDLTQSNPPVKKGNSHIVVVAIGTTRFEDDSTYVVFDKLLATNAADEAYQILPIANLDTLIKLSNSHASVNVGDVNTNHTLKKGYSPGDFESLTPEINNLIIGVINNLNESSSLTNFVDSGKYVATPMAYYLPLPENLNSDDAYYRNIKASYTITSCTPPTSHVQGRLLYEWASDSKKVKRPLANTHFRVIVDYTDKMNKSIGSVANTSNAIGAVIGGHWESDIFVFDESDEAIPLVDQYATMAEGVTDNEGNFSIDVINLNQKGNLGSGYLQHSEGSKKPPVAGQSVEDKLNEQMGGDVFINPSPYETMLDGFNNDFSSFGSEQNLGIQNSLNSGTFSVGFDAGSQSFEIGNVKNSVGKQAIGMIDPSDYFYPKNAHGPNPGMAEAPSGDDNFSSEHYEQFKRIFRIVIDGDNAPYYYPSKDVIELQPFESTSSTKVITHYVKEFKLRVKTAELNQSKDTVYLTEVQATVFRRNDKPEHLPLGEGDGKYTYKELISPIYNNWFSDPQEYEQLWPNQTVNSQGYTNVLRGLLQAERDNYCIQASSFPNKGSKAYCSSKFDIPVINDATVDWTNPSIPVIEKTVVLSPMVSRVLVHVKDSVSGQPLTTSRNTKVRISKYPSFFWPIYKSEPVDDYGYLELFANQQPLSGYDLQELNSTDVYFSAVSDGFKIPSTSYKAALKRHGTQSTPTIALIPAATIKGRIVDADYVVRKGALKVDGVNAYIQADSGKIEETIDILGNFEMPIAPKAGVKVKFIPKDVAWFDTTYVLTASDANKQVIDLGEIKLYRRKHRIQFNVTQKMALGFVGPPSPVSGATVQLGDNLVTTASNGTAKYVFENVSVNNYTFIVRGPQGQGYIPKTVNVSSNESRDFQLVNVELEKGSEVSGTVTLDGKPVKNARVYIEVVNSTSSFTTLNFTTFSPESSSVSSKSSSVSSSKSGTTLQLQATPENSVNLAFAPTGSITADANLVEARTDAQGKYKLQGVPVDNQKINIIATLDTTFTVSGDKQQASIVNGHAQTNLNLTSYSNVVVNKLYGFPLTVENITPVNADQIKVTGLVHWTEAISDFKLNDDNKVLRVEDVLFDLQKNGSNPAIAVVHDNSVKIPGITNLKLSYIDKYNVKLTSSGQLFSSTPLLLIRENGYGKISGKMQIVDNSFNYPSSYLNFVGSEFYLARLNPADTTVNNHISVATSALSENESLQLTYQEPVTFSNEISNRMLVYKQQPVPVYYLCDQNADPITFKLINFTAKANPAKSFIDAEGKIHLNTQLTCHIPHAQPEDFSVFIPDLILDENKVYPASSSKPISVKLEEWDLEARNWSFSTTEGGILSTDALLKTKIVEIPIGKFVLRSDMFFMDEFKLTALSMAGGKIQLQNIKRGSAHLNYEYKVGTDMKPHWNFSLLGSGSGSVASLPPLEGLPGYTIELNYVEILSNNEMVVQLMQKSTKPLLFNNPVARFEPLSIFNGPDYVGVTGLLNTGAPRVGDILLTADWTSPGKAPSFENVDVDFEGKGFVHFEANKKEINIDANRVKIEGRVLEKPDLTFNPIPAAFYARKPASYEVLLQENWVTQLSGKEPENSTTPTSSSEGYSLKITEGGMSVSNGDWGTLSFEGPMTSNAKNAEDIAPSITRFEVLGDVNASSESLSVSGIDTPFGSMQQVFDFNTMEMRGSLTVNEAITLGAVTINSGTIETLFGKSGFYVAGGCNAYLVAGLLTGTYNLGFMAGCYSAKPGLDHAWSVANSYISPSVINTCYKSSVLDQHGLQGIYTTVNRQVLDASFGFDFILASGYVRAEALLGGDFYANFSSTSTMGADAFVYVDVAAGLSCITGTSISGGLLANAKFGSQLQLNPNSLSINGSLDLKFNGEISQSLIAGTISKSFGVGCYMSASYNTSSGSQFNFHTGSSSDDLAGDCDPVKTSK